MKNACSPISAGPIPAVPSPEPDWSPGTKRARSSIASYDVAQRALLGKFIAELETDTHQSGRPEAGVLAIAAPVSGDRVQMTNIDWDFSIDAVQSAISGCASCGP